MLGMERSLLFPILRFEREATLSRPEPATASNNGRTVALFKLDWAKLDRQKLSRHEEWKTRCGVVELDKEHEFPCLRTLPEPWDSEVLGYHFALSNEYHEEIRRNARQADLEWGQHRRFDTNIREMLLGPAIEHVWSAFYLLADCVYNPDTKWWYRHRHPRMMASLLSYRFWLSQTGDGMVRVHSKVDDLPKSFSAHLTHWGQQVDEFLRALGELEEARRDQHDKAFRLQGGGDGRNQADVMLGLARGEDPVITPSGAHGHGAG